MDKVYLLMACMNYEGANIVRAYKNRLDAEYQLVRCQSYHTKHPTCPEHPPFPETDENTRAWDKHDKRMKKWSANHPAGEQYAVCDSFDVIEVEVE